jgi:hypothetical protein
MGVSGQHPAPVVLYPQEGTPSTHCAGGWVGPRAGLDTDARGKNPFASARDQTSIAQSVARHYRDKLYQSIQNYKNST